jgi:hypothetical protein
MKYPLLLILALFGALSPARASLNANIIPADAHWLIYADLDTMRGSTVGQELIPVLEMMLPKADALKGPKVAQFRTMVDAIVVHGASFAPEGAAGDAVLLLQGPQFRAFMEFGLMLSSERKGSNIAKRTDFPFPAYGAKPKPKENGEPPSPDDADLIIALPKQPVVLMSKSPARLRHSVELLSGQGPSLGRDADAPLHRFLGTAEGAYLFGATTTTTSPTLIRLGGSASDLFTLINAGCIGFQGTQTTTDARLDLVAPTVDDPKKLLQTIRGIATLATSSSATPKMMTEFLQTATISNRDGVVLVRASCPNDKLVAIPPVGTTPSLAANSITVNR